jgi:hypothetical protein
VLALLVAAGGAAWHFLADEHGRDVTASATAGANGVAPQVPAESIAAADDTSGPSRDADPAETAAGGAGHDASLAAAAKTGIVVKVVRHADGLPVAGATLAVVDTRKATLDELPQLARDPISLRARATVRLRTDEEGVARVPRPVAGAWVFASADGARGCIEVASDTFASQRIELFPGIAVDVRVVDTERQPCRGVDVALVRKDASFTGAPWRATTGNDGLARIADVDLEYSLSRAAWKAPRDQPFEVGFVLPLPKRIAVPVTLDPPPEAPVELTLPATGSLAFHVVDEEGAPLSVAGSVHVSVAKVWEADVPLDDQGHGSVAHVGLGMGFHVQPKLPERQCDALEVAGPTQPGETVDVELRAQPIGPLVVGHAVGEDGAPLGGFDLNASLDAFDVDKGGVPAGSSRAQTKLESDGGFRLDWSRSGTQSSRRFVHKVWLRAVSDADAPLPMPLEAKVDVVVPERGVVDIGTVKLAPAPRIVAGVVVDDEGQPVEAANLKLTIEGPPTPYVALHRVGTQSGPDGRFDVRGEIPPGRLSISASRGGYLQSGKPVRFTAGESNVTLVLRVGGALEGSIQFPEGFASNLLRVKLTLASDRAVTEEQRVRADGGFEFALLLPEFWDFELLLGRDETNSEQLALFHQVAIHPAELSQDPRLQPIDLASLVHLVDVTVRVPGGELAPGGAIGRRTNVNGNRGTLSVPLSSGHAFVPCPTVPVQLQAVVPGFLAESFRGTDAPIDLLLHHGYPLRLQVRGSLAKFPDLVALRVSAIPRDDAIASVGPAPSGPIQDGEATLVVPSTGRYRARIEFGPPPDPNASPDDARRRDRRTPRSDVDFEVKDVADEQVVELKVKG